MRVVIDGQFWNQPRTGSGQYLRHLWDALLALPPRPSTIQPLLNSPEDTYTLLMPPNYAVEEGDEPAHRKGRVRSQVVRAVRPRLVGGRSANFDKLLWEQRGVPAGAAWLRADLLHVPSLSAPILKGCPTVVTAHDMIPWVVPGYRGSLRVQLYLALAAAGVKRATLIMADSEASRQDVIRVLKVPPRKVHTVYLGMEPHPQYTPQQLNEVRARFGLPAHFAFYLGGFDRRKNVPLLLRAWRAALSTIQGDGQSDDGPLLVVGGAAPEPGGVFPDIMGEAASLGFGGPTSPVRFLGRVSEADKPLLMAAARLFVYPSSYEGFGFDPLEALSVGCPVVSSSGGSLQEVVGDGGLLVPPGDRGALCGAIVRAWTDDALCATLSERGKAQAAKFTWERTADETRRLYALAGRRTKDGRRRTKDGRRRTKDEGRRTKDANQLAGGK